MLGGARPTLLFDAIQARDDGSTVIDPAKAAAVFYADCSPDDQAEAIANLRPQEMSAGFETPATVCWRAVPSTYVVCADDQAVDPELQRLFARRAARQLEWQVGHSPFLSRPTELVELLTGLAAGEDTLSGPS
jgi:pimeloyl-ACP methyl ester carboxylesterase